MQKTLVSEAGVGASLYSSLSQPRAAARPSGAASGGGSPSPARVCSGACPFFEPLYDLGRKVAGSGVCEKHGGDTPVRVGNLCMWPRESRSGLVTPLSAKRTQEDG